MGVLSGVILTFVVLFIIAMIMNSKSNPKFFDEPGDVVAERAMNVFQVLDDGVALATGQRDILSVFLLYDEEGKSFYDNQEVVAPKGKCFRQVGIYKYKANNFLHKTVPVVQLMDGDGGYEEDEMANGLINNLFNNLNGSANFFEEPGDVLSNKSFKVKNVLENGIAIAVGKDELGLWYGLEVVLYNTTANFYDDQVVKLPRGKKFRQVGTYKDVIHTYPIVEAL